jgi:hypothetical protein
MTVLGTVGTKASLLQEFLRTNGVSKLVSRDNIAENGKQRRYV